MSGRQRATQVEGNKKSWNNGLRSYQRETIKLFLWINLTMGNKKREDNAQVYLPNYEQSEM